MKSLLHFLHTVPINQVEKRLLVLPADKFGSLIGLDVEFFAELCQLKLVLEVYLFVNNQFLKLC